jgi:hypothetical protein
LYHNKSTELVGNNGVVVGMGEKKEGEGKLFLRPAIKTVRGVGKEKNKKTPGPKMNKPKSPPAGRAPICLCLCVFVCALVFKLAPSRDPNPAAVVVQRSRLHPAPQQSTGTAPLVPNVSPWHRSDPPPLTAVIVVAGTAGIRSPDPLRCSLMSYH